MEGRNENGNGGEEYDGREEDVEEEERKRERDSPA